MNSSGSSSSSSQDAAQLQQLDAWLGQALGSGGDDAGSSSSNSRTGDSDVSGDHSCGCCGVNSHGCYTLLLLPSSSPGRGGTRVAPGPVVVGAARHAWLAYDPLAAAHDPTALAAAAAAAAVDVLRCCFGSHSAASSAAAAPGTPALPVSPGGVSRLSFSLINARPGPPGHAAFLWNFTALEEQYLEPLYTALAPVVELSAESQVRTDMMMMASCLAPTYAVCSGGDLRIIMTISSRSNKSSRAGVKGGYTGRYDPPFRPQPCAHVCPWWTPAPVNCVSSQPTALHCAAATQQVLHFAPARLTGEWSAKHSAYVVPQSQLPFLADSEWAVGAGRAVLVAHSSPHGHQHLLTPASSSPGDATALPPVVLHFVVYIPPADASPLLLLNDLSDTPLHGNSYVVPAWGGLAVLNPTSCCSSSNSSSSSSSSSLDDRTDAVKGSPCHCGSTAAVQLSHAATAQLGAVITAQLRVLFGLSTPTPGTNTGVLVLPPGAAGFTAWEVDGLLRLRAQRDFAGTGRVLGSLSRMVRQLPNLEVPDALVTQVWPQLVVERGQDRRKGEGRIVVVVVWWWW
jgi:Phosphatidylinositol-glycan biosynthesis class S protein